jgi:hypothetical protein
MVPLLSVNQEDLGRSKTSQGRQRDQGGVLDTDDLAGYREEHSHLVRSSDRQEGSLECEGGGGFGT